MSTLQRAEEIARQAHTGQIDKQGQPYINHPLAVMAKMPTEKLRIIAILHDVVEDHSDKYSFDMLRGEGFSESVVEALRAITRGADENYWDYIRRVADNGPAIEVKLADLAHNSDKSRIPSPTAKDIARWEKYRKATEYLSDVKAFKAGNVALDFTKEPYKYILHRKLYAVLREDYVALCDTLKLALESISKSVCPSAIIQGRAKKLDSFTEKCVRKAKKYKTSHFAMMTDLSGTRVILQTTKQVADFCELIKQYFEIDWENSEDTGARLGNDQFGYLSQHFIVSLRPELTDILGVKIDTNRYKRMKAEIQVRTLAQHINADVLHDRLYKSMVTPLNEHWREGSKIAAMAEVLDSNLHAFVERYDSFSLHQQSYLSVKQVEEELRILEAMNFGETHPFTLFENSLKMAAYLRNLGRYPEIAALLKPFIEQEKSGVLKLDTMYQTRLWFEYGLALLATVPQGHKDKYIGKALKNYEWLETDGGAGWQEARRFYVFMALTAGILAHSSASRDWLNRALRVDFTNPYVCAELLSHTDLAQSLLRGAVSTAEDHLRGHINEPEVYFVLGRLWLALKDEVRAAGYYMDGLLFYLSAAEKENMRVQQILIREVDYLNGSDSDVAKPLIELTNTVHERIYECVAERDAKSIWVLADNAVLAASANGYTIRKLQTRDLAGYVKELLSAPGYLFLETDEEFLSKAALILGLRVISSCRDLNLRFALEDKIRNTGGFYTLPCEAESFHGLFTGRTSYLTEAQIDAVAKTAQEKYAAHLIKRVRDTGETPSDLGERTAFWETLKDTYKTSNLDQAAYAPIVFEKLGYVFSDNPDGAYSWDDFSPDEQEILSRAEHGRWNAERVTSGWCYDPKRDNNKLHHDLIVAWDELSEAEKYFDKSVIDNFAAAGLYLHKR